MSESTTLSDGEKKRRDGLYRDFHKLVNMSSTQIMRYAASPNGKKSGLSRGAARKQGIASGRDRPRQIVKLLGTPRARWSADDYTTAARVVSFKEKTPGNPLL
jgi:Protein of unknown function (DUF3140)